MNLPANKESTAKNLKNKKKDPKNPKQPTPSQGSVGLFLEEQPVILKISREKILIAIAGSLFAICSSSCQAQNDEKSEADKPVSNPVAAASPAPSTTEDPEDTEESTEEDQNNYQGFVVTGSLNLGLNLTGEQSVTHVVALNPESGRSLAVAVDPSTGLFTLPLADQKKSPYVKADGTVDREKLFAESSGKITKEALDAMTDAEIIEQLARDSEENTSNEATPWIISYIDATKTGAAMVVSRFKANSLDSIAPVPSKDAVLDLGEVEPNTGGAETAASYEDILSATEMSESTALAYGALDDVSLRYVNPDIDNDGKLDMPVLNADGTMTGEQKKFILDFHNRFMWVDQSNTQIQMTDLKNKFPDEVVGGLQNLKVKFTGSGIVPEMEKSWFDSVPSSYKWKFSESATLSSNGSGGCTEDSSKTVIAADEWCTSNFSPDNGYSRYQFFREVATPPEGTYTLEVGGKTFTWTNVTVSDFSAGEGFLALMLKYVVDEKGTPSDDTDDTFTGVDFRFMQRSGNTWVAASDETVKLAVKGDGGYLSLKLDGNNNKSVGLSIPKKSAGEIRFANLQNNDNINFSDGVSADDQSLFKAGNMPFNRCITNPGLSYDDKLGMRFFF